ncbi:MAG: hypothetical protein AAGL09_02615 [Pseudomonadota bacterium]
MMSRLISFLLIVMAAALPSAADVNIAGHWTFEASVEADCTFGGTAHLERTSDNRFKGELTARQSCPLLPEDYLVRQDCEASQLGNQLSVRCRIVEFINGFESEFYYPDNFTLTIESSARMHGALVSAGPPRPAEWIRDEGGIS